MTGHHVDPYYLEFQLRSWFFLKPMLLRGSSAYTCVPTSAFSWFTWSQYQHVTCISSKSSELKITALFDSVNSGRQPVAFWLRWVRLSFVLCFCSLPTLTSSCGSRVEDLLPDFERIRVLLNSDGTLHWEPGGIFRTTCDIDIAYFPMDSQHCSLVIGTSHTQHTQPEPLGGSLLWCM